jgi:hypothetical protein
VVDATVVDRRGGEPPAAPRPGAFVTRCGFLLLAAAAFFYGERMAERSYPTARQTLARLTGNGAVIVTWCVECRRGGSVDVAAALARAGRDWISVRQKLPLACPYCGASRNDT